MVDLFAPPLVSVIGPIAPGLLEQFVNHYRRLGVAQFLFAFHAAGAGNNQRVDDLLLRARDLGVTPLVIDRGPWNQDTNARLRDHIRHESNHQWHLIADSDEFGGFQVPPSEMIAEAEARGTGTVRGLLLDRIATDGSLDEARLDLDRAFPVGGFFTHETLGGDPRKVVLSHRDIVLSTGNHRSMPSEEPGQWIVPVHHFKWRVGVLELLDDRFEKFASAKWRENSPAIRVEIARLTDHLRKHDGRIWLDPKVSFGPVSVNSTPRDWDQKARELIASWSPRPYDFPEE